MYFFTADEHYGHANSIKHNARPFSNVNEMNEELVCRHNEVVNQKDVTIHTGDFAWANNVKQAQEIIKRLNGNHIFLRGSHDRWMNKMFHEIWERRIGKIYVVACHYCLRTWPRSHYNSWHVYGHSHGRLEPVGKSWDVGVDNNNFYPVSFDQLAKIMEKRPDNPNLIKR